MITDDGSVKLKWYVTRIALPIVVTLIMIALTFIFVAAGMDRADKLASAISALVGVLAIGFTVHGAMTASSGARAGTRTEAPTERGVAPEIRLSRPAAQSRSIRLDFSSKMKNIKAPVNMNVHVSHGSRWSMIAAFAVVAIVVPAFVVIVVFAPRSTMAERMPWLPFIGSAKSTDQGPFCAIVTVDLASIHLQADESSRVIKPKVKGKEVEVLNFDGEKLDPADWIQVRLPADRERVGWMMQSELTRPGPCATPR